jgi:hypothetical protein
MNLGQYAKAIAAAIGAAAEAVIQVGLGGEAQKWATIVVAFLTILGVWAVPNKPATP